MSTEAPSSHTLASHTLGRAGVLIILAAALVVVVALLGFRSTLTEHEIFAAEPARELLEGGSVVLQQFAGEYRTKKPPGQSWMIAASLWITQSRSEYSARLPSALCATGLALLAGVIGARLVGRRAGIAAGWMTLTCYGIQVRARLAEADMALAFFVALSLAGMLMPMLRLRRSIEAASAAEHELPFKPGRYGFLFWLALGAAFLVKGPIALMFVLPPVVLFWLIVRFRTNDRVHLKIVEMVFLNPYAMAIGLAMIVGWPLAAYLTHPDVIGQWKYELAARAVGDIRRDAVWEYLVFVPVGTLPWCLFGFAMLDRGNALRRPVEGLIALWLVSGFVLLSLAIAFKAQHYCLPILLPVLLVSAAGFDRLLTRFTKTPAQATLSMVAWFATIVGGWVVSQWFIDPPRFNRSGVKAFAAEIRARVPLNEPIHLVDVGEERVIWYLPHEALQTRKRADDSLDAQLARLPPDGAYVICQADAVEAIRAKVRALDELAASADYRGRAGGRERRALIRVQP